MQTMYYIGVDVHKRTIGYCVKDGSGTIHAEGTNRDTRFDLDHWLRNTTAAVNSEELSSHWQNRTDTRSLTATRSEVCLALGTWTTDVSSRNRRLP